MAYLYRYWIESNFYIYGWSANVSFARASPFGGEMNHVYTNKPNNFDYVGYIFKVPNLAYYSIIV